MTELRIQRELHCPSCGSSIECSGGEILRRLQSQGMLRRNNSPEPELVIELLNIAAQNFSCAECNHTGLTVRLISEEIDEDWGGARKCEQCGSPISAERVEALPEVKLCINCSSNQEAGIDQDEPEFCPKCGSLMQLKKSTSGITRYTMRCTQCGRR